MAFSLKKWPMEFYKRPVPAFFLTHESQSLVCLSSVTSVISETLAGRVFAQSGVAYSPIAKITVTVLGFGRWKA